MTSHLVGIDHVQLAMPAGAEDEADRFYTGLLGLEVEPKPPQLAARGGRWYAAGPVRLHLGVDADFRPARKAHPGLVVEDLDGLADVLVAAGVAVAWDDEQPGVRRCFVHDPFGNRIELVAA